MTGERLEVGDGPGLKTTILFNLVARTFFSPAEIFLESSSD